MPTSRAQSMRTLNLICAVEGSAYFSRRPVIYDGQTKIGSVSVHEKVFAAFDAAGKRLDIFSTRLAVVRAVLDTARQPAAGPDAEAVLIAGVERFMKGDLA